MTATYPLHLQALRQSLVLLAKTLVDGWPRDLRQPRSGATAEESRRAQTWATQMQAERGRLLQALLQALQHGMDAAQRPVTPAAPPGQRVSLDALALVDEEQAERDIEVSRIAQQIDLRCETEWQELFALASGAHRQGGAAAPLEPQRYPGHPLVLARAIGGVIADWAILPVQRAELMRLAGPLAVSAMKVLYRQAADALRSAGAQPAVLRAPGRGSAPQASLRSVAQPAPEVLVQQLFRKMGHDPALDAGLQTAVRRLETVVRRLAQVDPALLSQDDHPTWKLLNAIAAHGAELPADDGVRSTDFAVFVEALVDRVSSPEQPQREQFSRALDDVQAYIDRDAEDQLALTATQRQALEQVEREQALLPLLRQQVQHQLSGRELNVAPPLRRFLTEQWTQVMARTMVREGTEAAQSVRMVQCVDELLASLRPPDDEAGRRRLVRSLPELVARLRAGMALIELPEAAQKEMLDVLMQSHERLLRAPGSPPAAVGQPERVEPPHPASTDWLGSDLFEQPADSWRPPAPMDTNVGMLPTVPMGLDEQARASEGQRWLQELQVGMRCKLFLQGQWATARLSWRSENGQFFMFASNLSGGSHSLTGRALLRLRAEGLATELREANLLQRALMGWMDDSGIAPPP